MLKFKLLMLMSLMIIVVNLFANGEPRGGGDVIFCEKSDKNNFEGYYFLDYFFSDKEKLVSKTDSLEVVGDIFNQIQIFIPFSDDFLEFSTAFKSQVLGKHKNMSDDLGEFITAFNNQDSDKLEKMLNDPNIVQNIGHEIWCNQNIDWTHSVLEELEDELLKEYEKIPDNCKKIQLMIKTPSNLFDKAIDNMDLYEFNQELMMKILDDDTVTSLNATEFSSRKDHLSWMVTHEYLRTKKISDARTIRRINEYFHSKKFLKATPEEIKKYLISEGIDINQFVKRR